MVLPSLLEPELGLNSIPQYAGVCVCVPATLWFEGSMDPRPQYKKSAPALPVGVSTPKAMPPPAIKDLKAPEPVLEPTVLGVPDGPAVETKSRRLASNYAVT